MKMGKTEKVIAYLRSDLTKKLFKFCREDFKEEWLVDYAALEKKTPEKYHEYVTVQPYICFNGAEYIAALFLNPKEKWSSLVEGDYVETEPITLDMNTPDGVYMINVDNQFEGHSLVVEIKGDNITVMNTYGGVENIFITNFNKAVWMRVFNTIWTAPVTEQRKLYINLWGFDEKQVNESIPEQIGEKPLELHSLRGKRLL